MKTIYEVDNFISNNNSLGVTVHTLQRRLVSYINQIALKDMDTKKIVTNSDISGILCELYGMKIMKEDEAKNIRRTEIIDSVHKNDTTLPIIEYYIGTVGGAGGKLDIFMDNNIAGNEILFENDNGDLLNELLIIDKNGLLI